MKAINALRPCQDCDHIEPLRERGRVCLMGYCRKTNSLQPMDEPWFCDLFRQDGQMIHPKQRFAYTKQKKKKRKRRKRGTSKTT